MRCISLSCPRQLLAATWDGVCTVAGTMNRDTTIHDSGFKLGSRPTEHLKGFRFRLVALWIVLWVIRVVVCLAESLAQVAVLANEGAKITRLVVASVQLTNDIFQGRLGLEQALVEWDGLGMPPLPTVQPR